MKFLLIVLFIALAFMALASEAQAPCLEVTDCQYFPSERCHHNKCIPKSRRFSSNRNGPVDLLPTAAPVVECVKSFDCPCGGGPYCMVCVNNKCVFLNIPMPF